MADLTVCLWFPQGERSVTMLTPLTQYSTGLDFAAISEVSNDATLVMPMIEDLEGLENVKSVPSFALRLHRRSLPSPPQ